MIRTDLGDLRRSHYSNELDSSLSGKIVTVMGWVQSVRGHGNISFLKPHGQKWSDPGHCKKGWWVPR